MDADGLKAVLCGLPPLDLKGAALLDERETGLFPTAVPRDSLRGAVAEIVAYTSGCQMAARRVTRLAPIPLTVGVPSFAL